MTNIGSILHGTLVIVNFFNDLCEDRLSLKIDCPHPTDFNGFNLNYNLGFLFYFLLINPYFSLEEVLRFNLNYE